jgi:hypothetical protein
MPTARRWRRSTRSAFVFLTALSACPAHAVTFMEFADPNPASGNQFGAVTMPLSTGNVVITSPFDDFGAGAVYLFDGATGALISTLRGTNVGDNVGSGGVIALRNGNFAVLSPNWQNGTAVGAGAITWVDGVLGLNGALTPSNSLVGPAANNHVGSGGAVALTNGFVVSSPQWDNGSLVDVGAVTRCNDATVLNGTVSAVNSLIGGSAGDAVGSGGVRALTNGNYVVGSPSWNNGAVQDAGAVTWGNGLSGVKGMVTAANSLVGSSASDSVGILSHMAALTNGNYVIGTPTWNNGAVTDAGAATWGNGMTGVVAIISASKSLVGITAGDQVGSSISALANGNYVVLSPSWNNVGVAHVGAATLGDGTTGVTSAVLPANSLVGASANDRVGSGGLCALSNGNYVLVSPLWNNGSIADVGAVTWERGDVITSDVVSAANSLVGSTAGDLVGLGGVVALASGNFVVASPSWDAGGIVDAGAVTWGDGTVGLIGTVSASNSLVGSSAGDHVGDGITVLTNGNYAVRSPGWDHGAVVNAGAVTWADGSAGATGVVSPLNSLFGSSAGDSVGSAGATALPNGDYVVQSPLWDDGVITDAGAVTWGDGVSGVSGAVSSANSLTGSTGGDDLGDGGVASLATGEFAVGSRSWHNGPLAGAGAATCGSGTRVASGHVSHSNSAIGTATGTNLQPIVADPVNETFIARFLGEGGGRVRIFSPEFVPAILNVTDIPADQGGWVRLTFRASCLDDAFGSFPIVSYGVWRRIPASGTWELVSSVPALQQTEYVAAVPTISNAASNDFQVTSHTTTPSIWFSSEIASGQSVDNLAPATPTQLTAAYTGSQTDLQWAVNSERDLSSYRVYRGSSAGFVPSAGNRIGSPGSNAFSDVGPAGSYYKVSAVDVNGNESGFALITPMQTTDAGDPVPAVLSLAGAQPNPARGPGLRVTFTLPSPAPARLQLIDVTGRRLLARDVGEVGVGRHSLDLAPGRRLEPGLYWLRLEQGGREVRARVAVVE